MTYKKALVLLIAGILMIQCLTACGKGDEVPADGNVTEDMNTQDIPGEGKPEIPDNPEMPEAPEAPEVLESPDNPEPPEAPERCE